MKTFICAPLALILLVLSACSNNDFQTQQIDSTPSVELYNSHELEQFMQSVDSLNACYVGYRSRGFWSSFNKTLADKVGGKVGNFAGRWIGGTIGSLTGVPGLTYVGYVGGRYLGEIVGYVAASAAVDAMFNCQGYESPTMGSLQLICDYCIAPSEYMSINKESRSSNVDFRCDSIGYYHNYVMVRVNSNKNKYITGNTLNMTLLFDDILDYFGEIGIDLTELANDNDAKTALRNKAKEIATIALQNKIDSGSNARLVEQECNYMIEECQITDNELNIFRNFTVSIAESCCNLSINEIHQYASDLSNVIRTSNLSSEMKQEFAFEAMTTINSSLCWVQ